MVQIGRGEEGKWWGGRGREAKDVEIYRRSVRMHKSQGQTDESEMEEKNEGIKIRRDWRNGDMLEITNKKRVYRRIKKKNKLRVSE